jgi:ribosome assembly protein YihI (activator of Der GTPase)
MSIETILGDSALDEARQVTKAQESVGQFSQTVLDWMARYRELREAAKALDALSLEVKAGRVLSARNKTLVQNALDALAALMAAAEREDEAEAEEDTKHAPAPLDWAGLLASMQAFTKGRAA